ncbi:hypothetical protein JEG39_06520, partial [Streptococcus agalactiae]|nr:hypothetical protein [Streptococcus agalactiae]
CLNMKKYSKIMAGIVFLVCLKVIISRPIVITIVKEKTSWINIPVCLQSEDWRYISNLFLFLIQKIFQNITAINPQIAISDDRNRFRYHNDCHKALNRHIR